MSAMNQPETVGRPARPTIARHRLRIAVAAVSVVAAAVGAVLVFTRSESPTSSESVVATLRVQGRPNAVLVGKDALWVVLNYGEGQSFGRVDRLDLATGSAEASVQIDGVLGGTPVRAGNSLWVGHNGDWQDTKPGSITEIDWDSGQVVREVPLDRPVFGLAYGDGSLWAVVGRGPATLVQIDPATGRPRGEPLTIAANRVIGLAFDNGLLWATSFEDGKLLRIDPSNRKVDSVQVGDGPVGLAVADGLVWVVNRGSGTVSRVDASTMEVVGSEIAVGDVPTFIAAVGDSVWVPDQATGTVTRIDRRTGERTGPAIRIAPRTSPTDWAAAHAVAAAPDGSLWVTSLSQQTVSRIDPDR
jgi:streptogramin lyase